MTPAAPRVMENRQTVLMQWASQPSNYRPDHGRRRPGGFLATTFCTATLCSLSANAQPRRTCQTMPVRRPERPRSLRRPTRVRISVALTIERTHEGDESRLVGLAQCDGEMCIVIGERRHRARDEK
jgi:hypothetical protein